MRLDSKIIEGITLVIFFSLFLYLALGSQWNSEISHDFPYGYGASDAFFHQSVAQYMKEQGRILYTPPYEVGNHENVYDAHPPMLFELSALISKFSGIEVYDSILLISAIMWAFSGIIIYLFIRRFNKNIALLSLPVMFLSLTGNFKIPLPWGYWLFITGVFFMLAVFWAIGRINLKHSWVLLGILLGAIGISHLPEAFFLAIFLGLYLLFTTIKNKKLDKQLLKKIIFAGILALVISAFSINIFLGSFGQTEGYRKKFDTELGNASVFIKDISWIGLFFIAGLILFFILKKKDLAGWSALFLFVVSYLTFLGLGKRAATHRWFWFFYLSFFFGITVYHLIKIGYKNIKPIHSAVISIILIIIFAYPLFGLDYGPGVMDPYNWQGLNFIAENLPKEARVNYFYSDSLTHSAALYNSKHVALNIVRADLFEAIENKEIRRNYKFGLADSYAAYLCDATPFSYGYYKLNPKPKGAESDCVKGNHSQTYTIEYSQDICSAEYFYFNTQASQPVLAQYNLIIRQLLLNSNKTEEIYSNELVSILKNNAIGDDCLPNETIKLE